MSRPGFEPRPLCVTGGRSTKELSRQLINISILSLYMAALCMCLRYVNMTYTLQAAGCKLLAARQIFAFSIELAAEAPCSMLGKTYHIYSDLLH
jgi:hypothetical protein